MKTKYSAIFFSVFLLIIISVLAVLFNGEKKSPDLNGAAKTIISDNLPAAVEEKSPEPIKNPPSEAKPKLIEQEKITDQPAEAIRQAAMLINGLEYRGEIKPNSSVYDLMNVLKEEKKIDFKGKNYSGMGFFVEEINGLKNNPSGKNWIYYVNGKQAPIGISYYKLKNNDLIEWKYENKSF